MSSIRGTQGASNFSGGGKRNFYYAPMGQTSSDPTSQASSSPIVDMSTILLRQPFSPAAIQIVEILPPGSPSKNDPMAG